MSKLTAHRSAEGGSADGRSRAGNVRLDRKQIVICKYGFAGCGRFQPESRGMGFALSHGE